MYDILVVELEPTHYKVDLWNCVNAPQISVKVLYTEKRNWAPDAGHDYKYLPPANHWYKIHNGKSTFSKLFSVFFVINVCLREKPSTIFLVGYSKTVSSSLLLIFKLINQKCVVFVDKFNTKSPPEDPI